MRMITLSFAALLAPGPSAVFPQQTPERSGIGSPPAAPPSTGVPIVGAAPPVGSPLFPATDTGLYLKSFLIELSELNPCVFLWSALTTLPI
jgi:hypothetical protein